MTGLLSMSKPAARPLPPLIFLTDEVRLPDPLPAIARLPKGAWVIYRHYRWPGRAELGRKVAALCRKKHLRLIVAADPALAAALRADGIHIPRWLAAQGLCRALAWRRNKGGALTLSAHNAADLVTAGNLRADAALLSPIFPTASHPGGKVLGPLRARSHARKATVPVFALGGMTRKHLTELGRGFRGLATASDL